MAEWGNLYNPAVQPKSIVVFYEFWSSKRGQLPIPMERDDSW